MTGQSPLSGGRGLRPPALSVGGALLGVAAALAISSAARRPPPPHPPAAAPDVRFIDVAAKAGIDRISYPPVFSPRLRHINALWANFVAAAAVGDFDGDGRDDILVISSRRGVPSCLYHNDGNFLFRDVTAGAGLAELNDSHDIATGALWFDYDNDGRLDLFIYRFGRNLLFRNNGDGTFTDVSAVSGLALKHQNALTAIAFDYNRDGYTDLLVGGYFGDPHDMLNLKSNFVLINSNDRADNGGTKTLYRNNGDGTFTDVTGEAGIRDTGWTIAAGHGDYDNDGFDDVYLANDWGPDRLYHNNGNGTFTDVTARAIGFDSKHGMSVEFADYDNDGRLDIFVSNITESWLHECNMLWHNNGDGTFTDVSEEAGTCDAGWAWGAKFADFANRGALALYVANGFVSGGPQDYVDDVRSFQMALAANPRWDLTDARIWPPIGNKTFAGYEHKRLFAGENGSFEDIAPQAGVSSTGDGRGVALLDVDNDGRVDILLTNCNGRVQLFRNQSGSTNHWLELLLTGVRSNRNAIGARVRVISGGKSQIREVNTNGYSAQSTYRLHFGLGDAATARLEIRWPSGAREAILNAPADHLLAVTEGRGWRVRD